MQEPRLLREGGRIGKVGRLWGRGNHDGIRRRTGGIGRKSCNGGSLYHWAVHFARPDPGDFYRCLLWRAVWCVNSGGGKAGDRSSISITKPRCEPETRTSGSRSSEDCSSYSGYAPYR